MTVTRDEGIFASPRPAPLSERITYAEFYERPDGKKVASFARVSSTLWDLADRNKPTEEVRLPNGTSIKVVMDPALNGGRDDRYVPSSRRQYIITKGGKSETVMGADEAANLALLIDAPRITLTEAEELAELNAVRVSEARVDVSSYVRKDGTFVAPYVQIRKLLANLGDGQSIDTPDGLKVTKGKGGKFKVSGGSGKGAVDSTFDDHGLAAQDLLSRSAGEVHPKSLGGESNIRSEVARVLPSIEKQRKADSQGKGAAVPYTARQIAAQRSIVATEVPQNGDDAGYVVKHLQTRGGIKDYDPAKDPAEYRGVHNGQEFPLFTGAALAQMRQINAGVLKHQGKERFPVKADPPKAAPKGKGGKPKGFVPRHDITLGFDADTGEGPKGVRGEVGKIGKVNVGVHQEGDIWHVSRFPGGKSVGKGKSRDEALNNAAKTLDANPDASKTGFAEFLGRGKSDADLKKIAGDRSLSREQRARAEEELMRRKRSPHTSRKTPDESGLKSMTDDQLQKMMISTEGAASAAAKAELQSRKRSGNSERKASPGGTYIDGSKPGYGMGKTTTEKEIKAFGRDGYSVHAETDDDGTVSGVTVRDGKGKQVGRYLPDSASKGLTGSKVKVEADKIIDAQKGKGAGKATADDKPDSEMFRKSKAELQSLADSGGSRAGKAKTELKRRETKREGKSSSGGGSAKGEKAATGGTPIDQRYFRMGKSELQNLASHGDAGAKREIYRRDKKRGDEPKMSKIADDPKTKTVGGKSSEPRPGTSITTTPGKASTPDGAYAGAPYEITVNGRKLSPRAARDVKLHAKIPDGEKVDIKTDFDGPNAAEIGQWLTKHYGTPKGSGRFDPKNGKSEGPKESIHGPLATPKATDSRKTQKLRTEYSREMEKIKRFESGKKDPPESAKRSHAESVKNVKTLGVQIRRSEKEDISAGGGDSPKASPSGDGKLRAPDGMDRPSDDLGIPQDGDSAEIKRRRQEYARMAKGIKSREGRLENLSETQRGKLAADKRQLKVMAANLRILLKR